MEGSRTWPAALGRHETRRALIATATTKTPARRRANQGSSRAAIAFEISSRHEMQCAPALLFAIRSFVAQHPAEALTDLIIWCGTSRLVFAGSIEELAKKIGQIMLTRRKISDAARFANIAITGGVLSTEALALFAK